MTEVFIAALSTTKLEMNEEDLEFYRDEKAKEIQEVRAALQQLHQFALLHKKERALANHALIWKSMLILSKIIGFQSEFTSIDKLHIPEAILTQQLWSIPDIFVLKHYSPRATVGSWETTAEKYYILMEGIVEKEAIRSSIAKCELAQNMDLSASRLGSKFKRNNKRKFGRTDEQIPICLNSKRSEGRNNNECHPGHFRSVTEVEMFQVSAGYWKRYVSDFKHLQEEYLMNFIRKKLNVSLNFDLKEKGSRKDTGSRRDEQSLQDCFYSIVSLERKSLLQFNYGQILLLYNGEMLVTTSHYKIETSKGCVLNPAIHQVFTRHKSLVDVSGVAVAKHLAVVLKISIRKLQIYFQQRPEERATLIELLRELQENRMVKSEQEKMNMTIQAQQNDPKRPSRISPLPSQSARDVTFKKIWQASSKGKDRIIGLKSIENLVEKTAKAAEIKHTQYLKRVHFSQDIRNKYQDENGKIPYSIFKDSMKSIQAKNQILKQALRLQKLKLKCELQGGRRMISDFRSQSIPCRPKMVAADSSTFLRRKIKDIYVKTEGEEEMIAFATASERPTVKLVPNTPSRETVGPSVQRQQLSDKDFSTMFASFGRGVMKKVQNGKVRRVNVK